MKKKLKPIPEFKSYKEEAEFWDTHDSTEYEFEEEGILEVAPHIKSPRDLSPRCPEDDKVLLTRYIDLEIAGGRMVLRRVPQLYCRDGHYTALLPKVEMEVRVLEAVFEALREPIAKPKKEGRRAATSMAVPEKLAA